MSVETSGSSANRRIPSNRPVSAAARYACVTSSTLTSRPRRTTRSVIEPVGTGARTEIPSTFPLRSGITSPIARAAPVGVGRGRRDDDLLRAGVDVLLRAVAVGEEAGRLDHELDVEIPPRQAGRIL